MGDLRLRELKRYCSVPLREWKTAHERCEKCGDSLIAPLVGGNLEAGTAARAGFAEMEKTK